MAKISQLPFAGPRLGSEFCPVVQEQGDGSLKTVRMMLDSLVERAALLAVSSTSPTLAEDSDDLLPTQAAVRAFVLSQIAQAIDELVGAAPGQLDQIFELAAALGNDANFAATVTAALAGKAARALIIETVAGAAYTIAATDGGKHKRLTGATAIALTVPSNANQAFPIGERVRFTAAGDGQVTIAGEAGVTLNVRDNCLKSAGKFAVFELEKVAADAWDVLGDLKA